MIKMRITPIENNTHTLCDNYIYKTKYFCLITHTYIGIYVITNYISNLYVFRYYVLIL